VVDPKTRELSVAPTSDAKRLRDIEALEAAWQVYVGRGTTPREFLMYAPEQSVEDAVQAYVEELPAAMGCEYRDEELHDIRRLLLSYIREMGEAGPIRV